MRSPQHATHWSARRLAKAVGLSFMTVYRIWQKYGLQPHRVDTFKFSTDLEFDAKPADIVGTLSGSSRAGAGVVRGRKVADSGA